MGHSVLVVPVPVLEPYVRARWQHYEPAWVSNDPAFTHAHVTALAPFHPDADPRADVLARVAAIAATTPTFEVTFADVDVFADGIIHLRPDPREPFAVLTARLHAEFPEFPPYGGAFGDVVPHLTLDSTAAGVTVAQVRRDLADLLPVAVRAERLELHWYDEGDCRVLAAWPLSRVSAPA